MRLLFHFRAGQYIYHDDEVAEIIPNGEKPDRAYGLRYTQRLKRVLRAVSAESGQTDKYLARFSPYPRARKEATTEANSKGRSTKNPLLFPFLVLESKSESSGVEHHAIFRQTAFAIRSFLKIQYDLWTSTVGERTWGTGGPFVWFLSQKGVDWRVEGAYIHNIKARSLSDLQYVCAARDS
jgi:hypothetical protein